MAVSCGAGSRCSLDPKLLWLWCRLSAAGPIQPLAWELPYAVGAALKIKKGKKKKTQSIFFFIAKVVRLRPKKKDGGEEELHKGKDLEKGLQT